jgi:CPA2 family monovalent cation:H+ antiporter-2
VPPASTEGAAAPSLGWAVLRTLLAVGAFVALMLLVGRKLLPRLLWLISRTGSRELFTLAVIAVALGIAYGASAFFGVSVALGAFFAGLVLRESEFSHRAAEESLPFRDAFAVLFFVSVGMLFDPRVLLERPLQVLAVTAIIMVGKSLAAMGLVLLLRYPLQASLSVAASLAQIGEFSFILVGLGASLHVLPPEAESLVVAGACSRSRSIPCSSRWSSRCGARCWPVRPGRARWTPVPTRWPSCRPRPPSATWPGTSWWSAMARWGSSW